MSPVMSFRRFIGRLLLLTMCLLPSAATPVQAGIEEMALFFDELVQYGEWVDYKHYGPVWYPTREVDEYWRPYLNGRWVPTPRGWVFETAEPWGWATYHFGNWMPSREYGWVWVPGSTWYPSTAIWRCTKQAIGWAPVPPPIYQPEPVFVPTGYTVEVPVIVQLPPPMYIFAPGPVFLLGLDQPFSQEYSYVNCGELFPPEEVQGFFPLTELINNFVYETGFPEAVFDWGPPLDFVSECTGVSSATLVQSINSVSVTNMGVVKNCFPPASVMGKRAHLAGLVPKATGGVKPVAATSAKAYPALNKPNLTKIPPNTPKPPGKWPPKGPSKPTLAAAPGQPLKGMSLPKTATQGGKSKSSGVAATPGTKAGPSPAGQPASAAERKAALAQERARMQEQKQQPRSKSEGSQRGTTGSMHGAASKPPGGKAQPAPSASAAPKAG